MTCSIGARLAWACLAVAVVSSSSAWGAGGFPFGRELTLDAAPLPGTKRLPTLDIGANGEVRLGLWCAEAQGQFSVAGDSVIFIPGAVTGASCSTERASRDSDLLSDLANVTGWQMSGEILVLTGPKTLRYRINTN